MRFFVYRFAEKGCTQWSRLGYCSQSETNPETIIAAVTVMGDRERVEATLAAGADGYLTKDIEPDLLHYRIARLMAGEPSLSPAVAWIMLARVRPD